ncbi:hypothetical protein C8Q72DRAFT_948134 [Fomitopsis betulina]|nr:hypothetical protein C8Q72DRAFT_948134 [Fomitopsis betulina]
MASGTPPESVIIVLPDMGQMLSFLQPRSGPAICDWVSAEVLALQRHIARLQALRNTTSPVHSLPSEIFVDILRHASRDRSKWLNSTATVCCYWREIILNTPTLWNDIDLLMETQFIRLCLTRSRDADINLRLEPKYDSVNVSTVVSLLAPHHPRISRLALNFNKHSRGYARYIDRLMSFLRVAEANLPRLLSLSVLISPDRDLNTPVLQMKQSHLPNIRRLSLSNVILRWESWPLPHLAYLCLEDIVHEHGDGLGHPRGDVASTLDILETCTGLETFIFRRSSRAHSPEPEESAVQALADRSIVPMRKMRGFRIGTVRAEDVVAIFAHVSLPRDVCVDIDASDFRLVQPTPVDHGHGQLIGGVLPTIQMGLSLPAFLHIRHVAFWLNGNYLDIWADEHQRYRMGTGPAVDWDREVPTEPGAREPQLSIGYTLTDSTPHDDVLEYAMRELDAYFPTTLESLLLHGTMHAIARETWDRTFAAFPCITRLELIVVKLAELKTCLDALRPTESFVPCSRLRVLELEFQLAENESDRQVLNAIHDTLSIRSEAGSRLRALYIAIKPGVGTGGTAHAEDTDNLPAIVEEVQPDLKLVVEKLDVYVAH